MTSLTFNRLKSIFFLRWHKIHRPQQASWWMAESHPQLWKTCETSFIQILWKKQETCELRVYRTTILVHCSNRYETRHPYGLPKIHKALVNNFDRSSPWLQLQRINYPSSWFPSSNLSQLMNIQLKIHFLSLKKLSTSTQISSCRHLILHRSSRTFRCRKLLILSVRNSSRTKNWSMGWIKRFFVNY